MLSNEELFQQYYSAQKVEDWETGSSNPALEEGKAQDTDAQCMDVDGYESQTLVFKLEGGAFHVCRGKACKHVYVRINATEKEFVCSISGRVVATSMETNADVSWTGRSTGSADPDLCNAGCVSAVWRNKRDAFAVSANAWQKSAEIEIDDVEEEGNDYMQRIPKASDTPAKRGAPCVIHTSDHEIRKNRKEKAVKRNIALQDHTMIDRLRKDASGVISKLFSVPLEDEEACKASSSTAAATDAANLDDPRLQNYDFVLMVGLRRYAARCKAEKQVPCLDAIHNIACAASTFVKERKKAAKKKLKEPVDKFILRPLVTNGQSIDLCSNAICSLWVAVCSTPPFQQAQFGDSFRPFAAGFLYGLKNGIVMTDLEGMEFEVVPHIPQISDQLPTLRTSASNHSARQLQSSSHRGMCAIHRAIASIQELDSDEQQVVIQQFKSAARVGFQLLEYVSAQVVSISKGRKP